MRPIPSPFSSAATAINAFFSVWRPPDALFEPADVRLVDFDSSGQPVERVTDTAGARPSCRSDWERQRLVTECRTTGGGPGGQAPLLLTREVRWVDETGAMLVELTWQSGDHATTRTTRYRKAELK